MLAAALRLRPWSGRSASRGGVQRGKFLRAGSRRCKQPCNLCAERAQGVERTRGVWIGLGRCRSIDFLDESRRDQVACQHGPRRPGHDTFQPHCQPGSCVDRERRELHNRLGTQPVEGCEQRGRLRRIGIGQETLEQLFLLWGTCILAVNFPDGRPSGTEVQTGVTGGGDARDDQVLKASGVKNTCPIGRQLNRGRNGQPHQLAQDDTLPIQAGTNKRILPARDSTRSGSAKCGASQGPTRQRELNRRHKRDDYPPCMRTR